MFDIAKEALFYAIFWLTVVCKNIDWIQFCNRGSLVVEVETTDKRSIVLSELQETTKTE